MTRIQNFLEHFYECSLPLTYWVRGTDILEEIVTQVNHYVNSLHQLYQFKERKLLIPKPTFSSQKTLIFWVHESIVNDALKLHGVRGGFQVRKSESSFRDGYESNKQSLSSPRILLDFGCDSLPLVNHLEKLGLEVVCLWESVADLYHYEIIELCSDQSIDLLVSTNERLFTPSEEWLDYLMPHRTRLYITSRNKVKRPKNLAREVYRRVYAKWKFKTCNLHQKHLPIKKSKIKATGGIQE